MYIGHLDVMRYFQKLFKRADIPVAYSEGFSPHQLLSFTPPLPLGMESIGEYADVRLTGSVSAKDALSALREQSVPEIEIMSFKELPDDAENAMASVRAAGYEILLPDKPSQNMSDAVNVFLDKSEINIIKKTKKSVREIDIRPLVYSLTADEEKHSINMLISSGSTDNLKPELVLDAMFTHDLSENNENVYEIKRLDQYTLIDDTFVSLDDI